MTLVLRRPLMLALVLGCAVSALASGRFSVRLIADGALSFSFIPALEIVAFASVYRAGRRPLPFGQAFDVFCGGNSPWLLWLTAVALVASLVPPTHIDAWISPIVLSAVVPFGLSALGDFRFFRQVMGRRPAGAFASMIAFRAIGWTAGIAYFLGIAIWSTVVPDVLRWFGR